jgi:hypothetical protein
VSPLPRVLTVLLGVRRRPRRRWATWDVRRAGSYRTRRRRSCGGPPAIPSSSSPSPSVRAPCTLPGGPRVTHRAVHSRWCSARAVDVGVSWPDHPRHRVVGDGWDGDGLGGGERNLVPCHTAPHGRPARPRFSRMVRARVVVTTPPSQGTERAHHGPTLGCCTGVRTGCVCTVPEATRSPSAPPAARWWWRNCSLMEASKRPSLWR